MNEKIDNENILPALLRKETIGRNIFVEQGSALSVGKGNWKYIGPTMERCILNRPIYYNNEDFR